MKSFLCAIFTAALLCGISLAQDQTPPPSASPQQSPTTQAPSSEQSGLPAAPGSQQTPQTAPTNTSPQQAPTRQAPSGEQAAQPNASGQQANPRGAGNSA